LKRTVANVPPVEEYILHAVVTTAKLGIGDKPGQSHVAVFARHKDQSVTQLSAEKTFDSAAPAIDRGKLVNNAVVVLEREMDGRMLILAGGLPIKIGDALVGGIGVGGAPGGHLDQACAQVGIDTITK